MMLFADALDLYNTLADSQGVYDAITGSLVAGAAPIGLGACLDTGNISKTWGTHDDTLYFSFFGVIGNATASNLAVVFSDGAAAQCSIVFAGDSTIIAHSGDTTGPVLGSIDGINRGSSLPGVWGPWFSSQIKIVIGLTGSIEVRMNGSTVPVLLLSNVNTRAGSSNSYATKFSLGGTTWTRFTYLWLNSGTGGVPNSWPGETRAIRQTLTGDSSVQFIPVPSAANNYSRVNEVSYDGDTTVVQSNNIGAEDLYTLASMSGLRQILGVNYAVWTKKNEAGHRIGAIQSIANGSADTSVKEFNPGISYGLVQSFQSLDPVGQAWTNATLSNALVGIKIVS